MPRQLNLTYHNNMIIVNTQGKYKGCDGGIYPYASTFVEGNGTKDLWDYIQYLEQKLKEARE